MATRDLTSCRIDGCDGDPNLPGTARGYCRSHYKRWRKYGDPLGAYRPRNLGHTCSVDGCNKPCKTLGLCSMHDTRLRRHGSLDHPEAWANAPAGQRWCANCETYKPVGDFYVNRSRQDGLSTWCKSCDRAKSAAWRKAHPDQVAEQQARRDPAYFRQHARQWAADHPALVRRTRARRKQRLAGAAFESFTREEIAERDGWRCQLCGRRINRALVWPNPRSLTIDHVIPVASGGDHTRKNVQAAHARCNISKGARGTDQLRLLG